FLVAWRRPSASIQAAGLSLVLVWLLSTGSSGGRYFVWGLAAALPVNVPARAGFKGAPRILTVQAHNPYSGGGPVDRGLVCALDQLRSVHGRGRLPRLARGRDPGRHAALQAGGARRGGTSRSGCAAAGRRRERGSTVRERSSLA